MYLIAFAEQSSRRGTCLARGEDIGIGLRGAERRSAPVSS